MEGKAKYDFAGWVTKNDIMCTDGVTIMHDAFKDNDGHKVPLVWNHDYSSPTNVLGYVVLKNQPNGVYGYGHFNETDEAKNANEMVRHGDVTSMSIGARKIKRSGASVTHGMIYEVSLVLAGANPGAMIETIVKHSEEGDTESGIIWTGTLIHSSDDILNQEQDNLEHKEATMEKDKVTEAVKADKTVGEVIDTLTDEQLEAVYALIGSVVEESDSEEGDGETVKQNVFNKEDKSQEQVNTLRHSATEALNEAIRTNGSFKQILHRMEPDTLTHGINSIEMLFPEAANSTNGNEPIVYKDPNTSYLKILNAVHKSPFSRIRTLVADLTEAEARAKGYIKGTFKKEEFFSLIKRTTEPTTIYKKQKLDRDDIVDITDFNVVSFMNREMNFMIKEEIARALLVGDGRSIESADKIKEDKIRPIISDHEFFTIQAQYTTAADFVEKVILAMANYQGSGVPSMYIDSTLLAAVKLLKGTDNRFLFGAIPSTAAIAAMLGLDEIISTTFMTGKGALIVNLSDYSLGATKGGELTSFDDFDIDFNQYKYLIETRLSGALTMPKSAIHMASTVVVGASALTADIIFGDREVNKPTTTTTTSI